MKLTAFILLIGCCSVSARSVSQSVTYSGKEVSLEKLFKVVKKQTGYVVFFDYAILEGTKPVNIEAKQMPLEEFLHNVMKNQPVDFAISSRTIVISRKPELIKTGSDLNHRLVLEVPPITVRGRIVNESGEPVIASVIIKGTKRGTTSNANGEFEVENVDPDGELIITSTATEPANVKINNRTSIDISVKAAVSDLDAVVINKGYYTESVRMSTGNVARVDAKAIEKQPISNPLQAIQGRMAGVYVQQASGVPGSAFNIKIRGTNSLRAEGSNYPLYIVDGVPFTSSSLSAGDVSASIVASSNPLNNLNPSDIASIEILKDADATAIYGSRGANGVVLITTKRGKIGVARFDLNVSKGAGQVTRTLDLLNTAQWLEMRNEAFGNDNLPMNNTNAPDLKIWDTTRYTDWQKVLIGGAADYLNLQATLSGGTETTQYLFSGNYFSEGTVFPGDIGLRKGSGHLNLNHLSADKKFSFTVTTSYLLSHNNLPSVDFASKAISLAPVAPAIYDKNGNLNWENSTWENPFGALRRTYTSDNKNLINNIALSYVLFKGFSIKSSFGYNSLQTLEKQLNPISSYDPENHYTASNITGNSTDNTLIAEPQFEYRNEISKLKFSILGGGTIQESERHSLVLQATGIESDAQLENIKAGDVTVNLDRYIQYKYAALFTRVNLNWEDKYLLNITGRRDGSSRFGWDRRLANFWAVGAAWIFSGEKVFSERMPFISFGKLRTSYGLTGSDQIPDYQYFDTYSSSGTYDNVNGIIPSRLSNPEYSWEGNKKFEAAIEVGLFKDAIYFSASFFKNRSSNQLVGYPLPSITGYTSFISNWGATVQNTGLEFILKTKNVNSKSFDWETSLNLTVPKNKLVSFPNIEGSSYADMYIVGQPISIFKSLHVTGVDPSSGIYAFYDFDGNQNGTDYPADFKEIINVGQKVFGGLGNSLRFKSLSLDFLFQFVKQKGYTYRKYLTAIPGTRNSNQPTVVMDRWQKNGDITNVQRFTAGISDAFFAHLNAYSGGDIIADDASFIRLKNLSLSWLLPSHLCSRLHLENLRIYVQGQNLITITNYLGSDPETQNIMAVPTLKVLTAGISLTL